MKEKKSEMLVIRLSKKDERLVRSIAERTGMSKAAVFRLGVNIIDKNIKPGKVLELEKFYSETERSRL